MYGAAVTLFCLVVATTSCVVGESLEPAPPSDPPVIEPGTAGLVTAPRHGDVIPGDTAAQTLDVAGLHERAGYRIDVQVLDDPSVPTSWTTIGTTLTASTPSNGVYPWQLLVAPGRAAPRRWPAGGILRIRVVGAGGEVLPVLFHDADECLGNEATGTLPGLIESCRAPVTNGLIVVSPSPTPADVAVRAPLLDRRGAVDAVETAEYYATINAPLTLTDFRTRFGFDATSVPTTFYNAADLGIGREMHCRAQPAGSVACFVSNYGEFGGDPEAALALAIAGTEAGGATGSFATVAMVYTPPADAPNAVQFMVYGAAGGLINEAQLDQFGDNVSVPNNCLNCHGGATYDPVQNAVLGARFLPFDAAGFDFPAALPRFRATDQFPRIHELNQLVASTNPPAAVRELIDGFGTVPSEPKLDFVPTGWDTGTIERKVYSEVVAVACRSCHVSIGIDFRTSASFESFRTQIADSLCGPSGRAESHDMPSAEIPLRRLWTTSARAYLVDYLDIPGACEP